MTVSKKTMLVEYGRLHYAQAQGDPEYVRIDKPLRIDLELPTSYARNLRDTLRHVLSAEDEFEQALISIDVPVRLYLRPAQIEQLIEALAKVAR